MCWACDSGRMYDTFIALPSLLLLSKHVLLVLLISWNKLFRIYFRCYSEVSATELYPFAYRQLLWQCPCCNLLMNELVTTTSIQGTFSVFLVLKHLFQNFWKILDKCFISTTCTVMFETGWNLHCTVVYYLYPKC